MHHAIAALFMMGYAIGSPGVAPMLPHKMERPFANLHRDLNDAGLKAYAAAAGTLQRLGEIRQAALTAPAAR